MFDALDECSDKAFKDISALIRRLQDTKGAKIFCTSRLHINVKDALRIQDVHWIKAHDDDVRNYLSIRVGKEWRHSKRFLEQIVDKLTQAAKGKSVPII